MKNRTVLVSWRLILSVAAVGLLALACATPGMGSGAAPAWYTDLDGAYPDTRYVAAVGSGDTRKDAEADAAGALARRFKVTVVVDSTARQRYADLVAGSKSYTESERSVVQTVTATASERLMNLRFSDPWTDGKRVVHCVAFLERAETAALYRSRLAKDAELAESLRKRADGVPALAAFALLDSALTVTDAAAEPLAQLEVISPADARMAGARFDRAGLALARDRAAASLGYRAAIVGDINGTVAAAAAKALAGFGLKSRDDGRLSIEGSLSMAQEPNPKYQSVRWSIDLRLVDETGAAVATVSGQGLENALSDEKARALALRTIEKKVEADLAKAVNQYLARVALGS